MPEPLDENERSRPATGGPPTSAETPTTSAEPESIDGYPVVWAVVVPGGLTFRCDYCRTTHTHGKGEGHRVAHCTNPTSPYRSRGYRLRVEGGDDR